MPCGHYCGARSTFGVGGYAPSKKSTSLSCQLLSRRLRDVWPLTLPSPRKTGTREHLKQSRGWRVAPGEGNTWGGAEGKRNPSLVRWCSYADSRSSIASIQCRTGNLVADCRWVWQPMLAVRICAGAFAVSAAILLAFSRAEISGCRME